ncbi:hypothetical protein BDA96_09G227200 [Sorghum bicolor]|uniref:Ribosomal eL28/Mak16 domain-containing protein n=1 Tax=Sorghum bicolor TaxID=4558 RepID=A0A921U5G4_SORBI|nr:hypothetical protein BDA96_09G227200 [Sorghum bicolor]
MATVPGDLIWQVVRKNNSFLVKQFGNGNAKVQFTKEPNNLYNVHSYKHSGLANKKTVTIQPAAGKDSAVVLSTTKTKKQNTPAKLSHKSVMRKEFRKMAKAVKNQVLAHGNAYACLYGNWQYSSCYTWQHTTLCFMYWILFSHFVIIIICCCDEP